SSSSFPAGITSKSDSRRKAPRPTPANPPFGLVYAADAINTIGAFRPVAVLYSLAASISGLISVGSQPCNTRAPSRKAADANVFVNRSRRSRSPVSASLGTDPASQSRTPDKRISDGKGNVTPGIRTELESGAFEFITKKSRHSWHSRELYRPILPGL